MAQTSQNNDLQRIPKANGNTKTKRKTKSIYYCVFTKYIKVSSSQLHTPSSGKRWWTRTKKTRLEIVHTFVSNKQSAKMCHDEKQKNGAGNHSA